MAQIDTTCTSKMAHQILVHQILIFDDDWHMCGNIFSSQEFNFGWHDSACYVLVGYKWNML